MLTCYLDDSGTDKESPIVTIAGYVGMTARWNTFEQRAKTILDQFGVAEIHGKEFNDTKGNFKNWKRKKKERFSSALFSELQKSASYGLALSISRTAFEKAKSLKQEDGRESAYGHCFREVIDRVMRSALMRTMAANHGGTIQFVVEAGNKNDADLKRIFNHIKISHGFNVENVLESISFEEKNSSIALQMADFFAFHTRRYAVQCERAKKYLPKTKIHEILTNVIPTATSLQHTYYTNEELERGEKDPNEWRANLPY